MEAQSVESNEEADRELCPPDAKKQKLDDTDNNGHVTKPVDIASTIPKKEGTDSQKTEVKQNTDSNCEEKKDALEKDGGASALTESNQREVDVGITEYISTLPGFSGVLKQRYSDFIVNEISKDGRLVTLTSTDLPCPLPQQDIQLDSTATELIGTGDAENLKELLASKDLSKRVLIEIVDDKALRTKVHTAIAKGFPGLETNTVNKDGKKMIEVRITTNQGSGLRNWPKGRGDYCKFVLYKENKDTMDTVGLLANKLRLKSGMFQYAGTKDKRAKTSQEVTAYRLAPEKLKEANKKLRNIVTGNYSYVTSPLRLGKLQGNKFTIVLRSVTGSPDQIDAGMQSMKEIGFINYYGMQRFGTSAIPSHHIGRALLQGNWKEAVELILKPRAGDDQRMTEARKYWWDTRDHRGAASKFPNFCYIERHILYGLAEQGTDYMRALNKIARNTRLLYVHAYQSYVWNTITSRRISQHGLKPIVGDLVISAETQPATYDDIDEKIGEQSKSDEPSTAKCKPTVVDASNIGDYSIYDVVLPLVGYDVVFPDNELKTLTEQLLIKDGLDIDDMRRKQKDFSLSGDYRHIVVKPKDVSWKIHRYDDLNIPLIFSDQDRMNNTAQAPTEQDGSKMALELQLTLPPSCYATMALRELLKIDTSSSHQASLNAT